jgi:hypothetical protein
MKRSTTRERAAAAAERWVERVHGKRTVIFMAGRRRVFPTAAQMTAMAAFQAGWLAGRAAGRRRCS